MRQRVLTSLMVLAAVLVSVLLATMPVIGQATPGKAKKAAYTPPKLPWGDPDLQGLWPGTDLIEVPMQRDLKAGERVEVTQEEFAQRQAKAERTAEPTTRWHTSPRTRKSASILRDTGWSTEGRRRSRHWWSIRPTAESPI